MPVLCNGFRVILTLFMSPHTLISQNTFTMEVPSHSVVQSSEPSITSARPFSLDLFSTWTTKSITSCQSNKPGCTRLNTMTKRELLNVSLAILLSLIHLSGGSSNVQGLFKNIRDNMFVAALCSFEVSTIEDCHCITNKMFCHECQSS